MSPQYWIALVVIAAGATLAVTPLIRALSIRWGIVDRPGELGDIARKLANAGVNLDLLYLTANMDLVIGVDDLEKAKSAL